MERKEAVKGAMSSETVRPSETVEMRRSTLQLRGCRGVEVKPVVVLHPVQWWRRSARDSNQLPCNTAQTK